MNLCDICQGRKKYCEGWRIKPKSRECALMLMMLEIQTDLHTIGNALLENKPNQEPPSDDEPEMRECHNCGEMKPMGCWPPERRIFICEDCGKLGEEQDELDTIECPTCEVGHPVNENGNHIPTQSKGMIPVTKCKGTGQVPKPQREQND